MLLIVICVMLQIGELGGAHILDFGKDVLLIQDLLQGKVFLF
jgi:hypothetical protein